MSRMMHTDQPTRRCAGLAFPTRRSHSLVVLSALVALTVTGCEELLPESSFPIEMPEVSDEGLPPAEVALPPVPPLDLLDMQQTFADGSYSVAGLLLNRESLRDQRLSVTAIVESIYECEIEDETEDGEQEAPLVARPDAPEHHVQRRPGCLLPNLRLVDNLRSPYSMLVVDYNAFLYERQLRTGSRYVFEGLYTQRAPGFMSSENGLLRVTRIDGDGIVHPPDPEDEEGEETSP